MMYHDIMLFIIHFYRVGNMSGHHHIVTHYPQGVGVGSVSLANLGVTIGDKSSNRCW